MNSANSRPLLAAKTVTLNTPRGRPLIKSLSFEVSSGELLLITGPNGSGKSTLLKFLLRDYPSAAGKLQRNVKLKKVSYIPQLQNLEFHLPISLREVIDISISKAIYKEAILALGLLREEHLSLTWNGASGGERQRTLLTCALLSFPELLILDEPFNHLDLESQQLMLKALGSYLKNDAISKKAVILVSHANETVLRALKVPLKHVELGEA